MKSDAISPSLERVVCSPIGLGENGIENGVIGIR